MKKILIMTALLAMFTTTWASVAAVTLNCESGNRSIEQGNCWGFGATSYTNTPSSVIAGSWSVRSNSLTNPSPDACWVKTPWMKVGSGNITFNAKFEGTAGTTRGIIVSYISNAPTNAPYYEGIPVQFYTYDWPQPWPTATYKSFTVPIPAAIANSNDVYKIRVSFIGTGGTARIISDDYVFPGVYWSDPANNCMAKAVIQDADHDGVPDAQDAYPNDALRAYNSYYPSQAQNGTLAFEDLWPAKGDYDFNDVVVDYNLQTVTNAANNVVEVMGKFVLKATGASYHNGFGFQLDGISPDKIISVTGNSINSPSIFTLSANGTEAGQTYANIIVFDDFYKAMQWPGTGAGINTDKAAPFVPYVTLNVKIVFIDNGVAASGGTVANTQLTADKFNFYIVANQTRGKEIHLSDHVPSSLMNTSLFGTENDDSKPADGKYFKTATNLPWAINIIQGFQYPIEKAHIDDTYLHFVDWAASSGANYQDWYTNTAGNRNDSLVY